MTTIDLSSILSPEQKPITKESILEMIKWVPRRKKLSIEWRTPLHQPEDENSNWRLVLPFCETLKNAFNFMCDVDTIGLRESKGRCFTFLNDAKENPETLGKVRHWLETIGNFIAIRDCLALSFSLDYDREEGNPIRPQTRIGALRTRAKPYDTQPTSDTFFAADELIQACLDFLHRVNCYRFADVIVAMPPSDLSKPFNLPIYLAEGIANPLGKPNLSSAINTTRSRIGLKNVLLENKLETLEGTIRVDPNAFKGKTVLIVDDLYQSGVSINYAAMLLLEAGAKKVFGLACEKTCSNDDNISRR